MTDGTHGSNAGTTQGSSEAGGQCYAIVHNMPGYLPVSDDRVVAIGEDAAARAMRDEVDRLLDYAVEGEQMSPDEASSDLASIDSAIADGDLQYRIRVDGGQSWPLPEINEVVNCIPIDHADLSDEERDYLDIPAGEPSESTFTKGQRVRITGGPFAGRTGVVGMQWDEDDYVVDVDGLGTAGETRLTSSQMSAETTEERIERLAAKVRDHLHAEAMRAVADPADEFGPDDVTTWRILVEIEPAEIDPETGEEDMPETITATCYDNNHHSNVLFVTFDGEEIEEIG